MPSNTTINTHSLGKGDGGTSSANIAKSSPQHGMAGLDIGISGGSGMYGGSQVSGAPSVERIEKSADLGLRSQSAVGTGAHSNRSHSAVGTAHFIAPEVIWLAKYGRCVDWWAVGVTFYECVVRRHLFQCETKPELFKAICHAVIDLQALKDVNEVLADLVAGLLNRDIKMRLGTQGSSQVKEHAFFRDIDWIRLYASDLAYKPAQFLNTPCTQAHHTLFYNEDGEGTITQLGTKLGADLQSGDHSGLSGGNGSGNGATHNNKAVLKQRDDLSVERSRNSRLRAKHGKSRGFFKKSHIGANSSGE
jgi:serine/threonine protein kinase